MAMTMVVLAYENGERQEVLLSGVPRVGEHIRLSNGKGREPTLIVEYVLWVQARDGEQEPSVVVAVKQDTASPREVLG